MMKVLALFVVIAVVVCKGEANTDDKWELKKGSPRVMKIVESTMKDPALEQEILNGLILGAATGKDKQVVAEKVIDHLKSIKVSIVVLILPTSYDVKDCAFASSTTEYVRIQDDSKKDADYYVFKV